MVRTGRQLLCAALVALTAYPAFAVEPNNDLYGDPLPPGAVARIGTVRLRNAGEISFVALSRDGKFLVTTADKRPLRVWNAATGALVREISPPKEKGINREPVDTRLTVLTFTPDDQRLYALTQYGDLLVCDITTGKWSEPLIKAGQFAGGEVSANGTLLMCVEFGEKAITTEIFALGKDKPIYRLDEEKYGVARDLTDNHRLLAAVDDDVFKVWDLKANKELSTRRAPVGIFLGGALSPDGKALVAACGPKDERAFARAPAPKGTVLCKWDLATGKELFRVAWEGKKVEFSPDGSRVISIVGTEVLVADATTGKLAHRLKGHGAWAIFDHAFSSDGKKLVTGGRDHTAIIWDLTTGKKALDFESPRGPVDVLAYSPDGRTLFAGCAEDHTGGLWDPESGKRKSWLVADGKGNPLAAAFTPDSKHVVVGYGESRTTGTGKDWTARLWSVADGKVVRAFGGHTDGVHQLVISPDGKQLVTRDWDKKVRLWELGTGKLKREIEWVEHGIPVALVIPKADQLIGVSGENGTEVIDLLSGKSLKQFKRNNRPDSLTFTPDARKIAISDYPNSYHPVVCDAASGEVLQTFADVRLQSLSVMAFSADGRFLAVSEMCGGLANPDRIRLFDLKTGELVRTIRGHTGAVCAIAFSPTGTRLATGSWDSTVLIWDLTTKP